MPANRKAKKKFPVLLLAGYANQPEHFKEGLKDFRDFLARMRISGKSGFKLLEESQLEKVEAAGDASSVGEQRSQEADLKNETAEPGLTASQPLEAQVAPSAPAAPNAEAPSGEDATPPSAWFKSLDAESGTMGNCGKRDLWLILLRFFSHQS